jgi:hypothetical protein
MRRRWIATMGLLVALLLAPAAGAAPGRGDGEPGGLVASVLAWLSSGWRAVASTEAGGPARGPEIDPDGAAAEPPGGGGGAQAACSGDCGPYIDPDG